MSQASSSLFLVLCTSLTSFKRKGWQLKQRELKMPLYYRLLRIRRNKKNQGLKKKSLAVRMMKMIQLKRKPIDY